MNSLTINNSPSFTSRNSCIRDAQWVCHKINSELPHYSTTKFTPAYKKLIKDKLFINNPYLDKNKLKPKSMDDIYYIIMMLTKIPLNQAQLQSNTIKKNLDLLNYSKNLINKIGDARTISEQKFGLKTVSSITYQLNKFKIGNCYEDAKMAELILTLNGISNACTARLSTSSSKFIDHVICLFNKDGTPFDGNINKSTIIIDNWASKVDYAHNMNAFYKNMFNNYYFNISQDDKIKYIKFDKFKLSSKKIKKLKKEYPQFIFNGKNKFMDSENATSPICNQGLLQKILNFKRKLITI